MMPLNIPPAVVAWAEALFARLDALSSDLGRARAAINDLHGVVLEERRRHAQTQARQAEVITDLQRSEQKRWALESVVAGQESELRELKARLAVHEAKERKGEQEPV